MVRFPSWKTLLRHERALTAGGSSVVKGRLRNFLHFCTRRLQLPTWTSRQPDGGNLWISWLLPRTERFPDDAGFQEGSDAPWGRHAGRGMGGMHLLPGRYI